MEAEKLRIGNLVYYTPTSVSFDEIIGPQFQEHDKKIFEIRSICADPVNKFNIHPTGVNPVLFNGNDKYARVECSISFIRLSPIPITEDWLVKFGFKKYPNELLMLSIFEDEFNSNLLLVWENNKLRLQIECDDGFYNRIIKDDIKHLHELQNIFYDLTDKEITASSKP